MRFITSKKGKPIYFCPMYSNATQTKVTCYHCGEDVVEKHYHIKEKEFCCRGCQTVYEIINKSDLCSYYDLEHNPGINQKQEIRKGKL